MYTVYDFINNEVSERHMRFGWKIEVSMFGGNLALTYTMLNFDWNSLKFLNDEVWNMFLNSKSFQNYKQKLERAKKKNARLYYEARNINDMRSILAEHESKIDLDKLIDAEVKKRSLKIYEENEQREKYK